MFAKTFTLSLAGMCLATTALSVPIGAFSEVSYNHSFILNSGTMPAGLRFSLAGALERTQNAGTNVDAPVTNVIDVPSVQVGQVIADPPVPYFDRRGISETTPDGTQAARASYNVNILQTNGAGSAPDLSIVTRDISNEGASEFVSTDGSVDGDASSDFLLRRRYEYENIDSTAISFNIIGEFSARVLAEYTGGDGFARSSLSYSLGIEPTAGVSVSYLPLAPYLRGIDDSDLGATVSDALVTDETGFDFSASASAIGSGGSASATFDGGFRYALLFTMQPGSSFVLTDAFVQTNAVEYRAPGVSTVPLPASLPLLLAGIGGLSILARRRGTRNA